MENKSNFQNKEIYKLPCVYMLKCSDGSLYTGWTNDFEKRLKVHNSGKGAKYTRSRLPAVPVYVEFLPSKSLATKREVAIKKLPRSKKRQLIDSYSNQLFMVYGNKATDS